MNKKQHIFKMAELLKSRYDFISRFDAIRFLKGNYFYKSEHSVSPSIKMCIEAVKIAYD